MDNFNYIKYLVENRINEENLDEGVLSSIIDKVKNVVKKNISKLDSGIIDDIKSKIEKALGKPINQLGMSDITKDNAKKVGAEFGLSENDNIDEALSDKYPKFFTTLGLGGLAAAVAGSGFALGGSALFFVGVAAMVVAFIANMDMNENIENTNTKVKVSELKAEIKEMILASMNEGEDGHVGGNTDADFEREAAMQMSMREEEEDDIEAEIEADAEEPEMDMDEPAAEPSQEVGLTPEEQSIQASLKDAYDNAMAMGDEKLAAQIGNSITFFTRTHVVER